MFEKELNRLNQLTDSINHKEAVAAALVDKAESLRGWGIRSTDVTEYAIELQEEANNERTEATSILQMIFGKGQ